MKKIAIFTAAAIAFAAPAMGSVYDATPYVVASSKAHNVPTDFALKVAKQESGIKCGKIGGSGERGPLQVMPATAKGLGYPGIRKASCKTQTEAGMKHLARCYHGMKGNQWMAAACHNMGFRALTTKAANLPRRVKAYATKVMGHTAPVAKTALEAPVRAAKSIQRQVIAPVTFWALMTAPEAPKKPSKKIAQPVADRPTRLICNFKGCPISG